MILHRTDTLYPQRSIASNCILAATLIFAGWAGGNGSSHWLTTRQSEIDLSGPIRRTPELLSGFARLRERKDLLQ
jgi:hypothetical protein